MTAAQLGRDQPPVGVLLKGWRERRRLSQLALALATEVSARHLSFVETGRSRPSTELILRLADELDVPLRERNRLLLAAGFAPVYAERPLDSPQLTAARTAISSVLTGHLPFPAVLIDRHWNLLEANAAVSLFLAPVAPWLLAEPVNVLRLSLHPDGMAPSIENLGQWREHLLSRLRRQAAVTGDDVLRALYAELRALPGDDACEPASLGAHNIAVPLRFRVDDLTLSFVSMTAVFGTPLDISLSELAIESFYPADTATSDYLAASMPSQSGQSGLSGQSGQSSGSSGSSGPGQSSGSSGSSGPG